VGLLSFRLWRRPTPERFAALCAALGLDPEQVLATTGIKLAGSRGPRSDAHVSGEHARVQDDERNPYAS